MTTTRRGISNHEMLHWLEGYRQILIKKGYSEHESLRCALAMTFARSGEFTREQAWEAADDVSKLIPTPTPRGNDGQ